MCRTRLSLFQAVCIFVLFLFHHLALAVNSTENKPLNFSQVVQYSLLHSPSIISAKSGVSSAEADKLAAVAAFLPSLSLSNQAQDFHSIHGSSNSVVGGIVIPTQRGYYSNVTSANFNYNLYNGGKDLDTYHASLNALRSANLTLTSTLDSVFMLLLSDYTTVCIDQVKMRNQDKIISLNNEIVKLVNMRFYGQVSSKLDLIQSQQQLLEAQVQSSQLTQKFNSDLSQLYSDMGFMQMLDGQSVQEWIPSAPATKLTTKSINMDPEVQAARQDILYAQNKVQSARDKYYPTVSLSAQYNYLGVDSASYKEAMHGLRPNNYSFGLVVSIPLLPHYDVTADVDSALADLENSQGKLQDALTNVSNRLTKANEDYQETQTLLKYATRADVLAKSSLKLTQDNFNGKHANRGDVDAALISKIQSSVALSTAQMNYRLAGWRKYRAINPRNFITMILSKIAIKGTKQ